MQCQKEGFNSKLLRRRYGHTHFGAGCLSGVVEKELKRQLGTFEQLEPRIPRLSFDRKLRQVKESDWFSGEIENRKDEIESFPITIYAEAYAVGFFLGYSALCLHMAAAETNRKVTKRYMQLALSVLLPIVSIHFLHLFHTGLPLPP